MNPTSQQLESIEYEGENLFIKAGAGTGKTATLTAKIAYLLAKQNKLGLKSVQDVLAVTFTDRATAELASRIRRVMREQGLEADALLVDGAWISTIHGMCARILREHAFELGLDPAFKVMTPEESDELLRQAVEYVIDEASGAAPDSVYAPLFREFKATANASYSHSTTVEDVVGKLVRVLATLPGGLDELHQGPEPTLPSAIARVLQSEMYHAGVILKETGSGTKTVQDALDQYASIYSDLDGVSTADEEASQEALIRVFQRGKTALRRISDEDAYAAMSNARSAIDSAYADVCQYVAYDLLKRFLALANATGERFALMKQHEGKLDNDDLLIRAYRALEGNPTIASRYSEQFRLTMIDEFQDTDRLQVRIAKTIGSGNGKQLCTVGDAQQSIYGFRGTDVGLFRRFEEDLPKDSASLRLDMNFRSHSDIISFVNKVFGAPGVFGDDFLVLEPTPNRTPRVGEPAFDDSVPRIDMLLTTGNRPSAREGIAKAELIKYEAEAIAARLARFAESGWKASQMVLLLGTMTNSDVYAAALREEGFEVVITGGSVFWKQPEPSLVEMVLRLLADPYDDEAAYQVLASKLVGISSDELLLLSFCPDGKRRAFIDGLFQASDDAPKRIVFARDLIVQGLRQIGYALPSQIVMRMFVESGYIARMEERGASGSAECANLLKAIRFVEDFEADGAGIAHVASVYSNYHATLPKNPPGALAAKGNDAIQIMTIHGSKGLEFPIVALAEFERTSHQNDFICQTSGGETFISMLPGKSAPESFRKRVGYKESKEADDERLSVADLAKDGIGRGEYHRRLALYSAQEEVAESRRLFYVGVTRAREALVIAFHPYTLSAGGLGTTPITDDLGVLFGDGVIPIHDEDVDYGGSMPAHLECTQLKPDDEDEQSKFSKEPIPDPKSGQLVNLIPNLMSSDSTYVQAGSVDDGTFEFSYSSLPPVAATTAGEKPLSDAERDATFRLGLAFHLVAEYMVDSGEFAHKNPGVPDDKTLRNLVKPYRLDDIQLKRLNSALSSWASCNLAMEAAEYQTVRAEVPFYQAFSTSKMPQRCYLDGEIDLLCMDEDAQHALIVDYKTGGSEEETQVQLQDKHRLQALCYTQAVLSMGVESVDVVFVRVERQDDDGQPETVRYTFDASQELDVHTKIENQLVESGSASMSGV